MREWAKQRFPFLRPVVRRARRARHTIPRRIARAPATSLRLFRRTVTRGFPGDSIERRFSRIYRTNAWRGGESRSGPGSALAETEAIRARLPGLVRELGVRTLLDIPCGDFFWMLELEPELGLDSYLGADVVTRVIEQNARFAGPGRTFVRLDLLCDPLPRSDLVVVRDALDHLSIADVRRSLANITRSGSTYLLATTYPGRAANADIRSGEWRPLNLSADPFNLPTPIELIDERSRKPGYADKCLGLWRVADLRV